MDQTGFRISKKSLCTEYLQILRNQSLVYVRKAEVLFGDFASIFSEQCKYG